MLPLFTTPWAFAALLAIPALAGLYWLRNSFRLVPVSSLLLWLDQAEARTSGLRVRRLQTPLLFFLELTVLILLAVAATGPRLETSQGHWPLVVVLDDSYSMLAGGDESPKALALEMVADELRWGDEYPVRFVLAGTSPQVLGETAHDWSAGRELLRGWRCLSPAARLSEAMAFAAELGGDKSRILVVTDQKPPDELPAGRIVWRAFGRHQSNLALVRAGRAGQGGQRCFFEIANFSAAEQTTSFLLKEADRSIMNERLTLKPKEVRRVSLQIKGVDGALSASLPDDALAIDNHVILLPEELPKAAVEIQVKDDALRALMENSFDATGLTKKSAGKADLFVVDDVDLASVDAETWVVQLLREKEADAFTGPFVVDRTHPLTEGLSLQGVVWGGGKAEDLPGRPVILAGSVPLLTEVENATGQRILRWRLRPDLSTLTELPAWPVLVWNLVHWRATELPGLRATNLRLGQSAVLKVGGPLREPPAANGTRSVPTTMDSIAVRKPSGASQKLNVHSRRATILTDDVGVYEVRSGDKNYSFAVNALSAEESDLSSCVSGRWGEWTEDGVPESALRTVAWVLLLLALGVLTWHLALASRGAR
ncbi:MAG: BatA domain-containing protein [Gemmataceae bacterium]|nr:BatA domain-containing protein [Gemmataceae bacterium]MCI0741071.1 BatA domain-containing protein [Gemmataceae bacterium]